MEDKIAAAILRVELATTAENDFINPYAKVHEEYEYHEGHSYNRRSATIRARAIQALGGLKKVF